MSDAPAPPGLSAMASVVHFVVSKEFTHWTGDTVVVSDTTDHSRFVCASGCGPGPILPPNWPDSIRAEADSAYASYVTVESLRMAVPPEATEGLHARVGGRVDQVAEYQACETAKAKECSPTPIMMVSSMGFNRDSTYAVVETGVMCGMLCGSGYLWVLRRTSGHDWSVLWKDVLWVS